MIRKFYTNVFPYKGKIYERFVDDTGKKQFSSSKYKPSLFVSSTIKTGYETIHKQPVKKIQFDSIYKAKDWAKYNKDITLGNIDFQYPYISDYYPNDIEYNVDDVDTFYLDIEVTADNGFPDINNPQDSVTAITVCFKDIYYVWGLDTYTTSRSDVVYRKCQNEDELILLFISFWTKHKPDILTGWYVKFFDIPYLIARCIKLGLKDQVKLLSPIKTIFEKHTTIHKKDYKYYDIYGVAILDYIDLYKKFNLKKQESYKLGYIGYVELGMEKIQDDEIAGYNLYKTDYQKFIDYNIRDVEIVVGLEKKKKMIELVMFIAYHAKINYQDVFSPVKTWDNIIFNYLKQHNIAIPLKDSGSKGEEYIGAYVKIPETGRYTNILLFDIKSLYPSIICSLNISPETLCEPHTQDLRDLRSDLSVDCVLEKLVTTNALKKHNYSVGVNGALYDRTKQGMLPILVKKLFADRTTAKTKMLTLKKQDAVLHKDDISYLDIKQHAFKILLNSLYGGLGNQYFRFYNIDNAEAITLTGQTIIKWIIQGVDEHLNKHFKTKGVNYIFYCDTDSIFISLPNVPVDKLQEISDNVISPAIEDLFVELHDYLNMYENFFTMGRELIATTGIWTAKKRYMMNVTNKDNIDYSADPILEIKGIESVRTTTPEICRKKIEECIKLILREDESVVEDFINNFEIEFNKLPPEDIASPTTVNNIEDYMSDVSSIKPYNKSTPIQVRGSILYNMKLKEMGLTNKYSEIQSGEKVKYVYLKVPNGIDENVIAFSSVLPNEYDLHDYIDYKTQFTKSFLEPIKRITTVINWRINATPALDFL